ncbi:MAG: hypothetical protein K940chlam1_01292 [Candidatus Anoxychlamydiales bacterium]|nr:hypothetical protein [Candidatus Anoxychlamydiales bacterium]NGX35902.1 hypothetical protein [Candidatus Anoxychlamydiales bacterium]
MFSILTSFFHNNAISPNRAPTNDIELNEADIQSIVLDIFFSKYPERSLKILKKTGLTVTDYLKIEYDVKKTKDVEAHAVRILKRLDLENTK